MKKEGVFVFIVLLCLSIVLLSESHSQNNIQGFTISELFEKKENFDLDIGEKIYQSLKPTPEIQLADSGNGELLWKEDFEDFEFEDSFWSTYVGDQCDIGGTGEGSGYSAIDMIDYMSTRGGNYSLRYDSCYTSTDPLTGKPGCHDVRLNFGDLDGLSEPQGNKFPLQLNVSETDEIFVRYWIRYEPDGDPVLNNMAERFLTIDTYPGLFGYTFFLLNPDTNFGNPMTSKHYYYTLIRNHNNPLDSVYIRDGEWHKLEFYVKYNQVAQTDGIIQGWVDDEMVLDWQNVEYYQEGRPRTIKLNMFSNAFDFCTSSPLQIDDFEVWDGLPNLPPCVDGQITSLCECGGSARDYGYCLNGEWDKEEFLSCAPTPIVCDDGIDNDCDGLIDCEDPSCFSSSACNLECSNATVKISALNNYVLFFNEEFVGQGNDFQNVDTYIVDLKEGNNNINVNAFNNESGGAFVLELDYCGNKIFSDDSWKITGDKPYGWLDREYDSSLWNNAYLVDGISLPSTINESANWIWTSESNIGAQAGYDIGWFRKDFNIDSEIISPCQITYASWNNSTGTIEVEEGDLVQMNVQGTNCDGKEIVFDVYENIQVEDNQNIVVDHNAVLDFDEGNIPDYWINQIKTQRILIHLPGRSHAQQYVGDFDGDPVSTIGGLKALEAIDTKYAVEIQCALENLPQTDTLKVFKGQYYYHNGEYRLNNVWECRYDDNQYWTGETGRSYTRDTTEYAESLGNPVDASIFGWSYHIINENSVHQEDGQFITFNNERFNTYINTLDNWNSEYNTNFVYATAPVDRGYSPNTNYLTTDGLRVTTYNQMIRDEASLRGGILIDQADIENWNNDFTQQRSDYYESILLQLRHTDWDGTDCAHGGMNLCIAKAKSLWWLAARLAGWDGTPACKQNNDCGLDGLCEEGICVQGKRIIQKSNPPQNVFFEGDNAMGYWTAQYNSSPESSNLYLYNVSLVENLSVSLSMNPTQNLLSVIPVSVIYCTDNDGDGWVVELNGCELDSGQLGYGDCDDNNSFVFPNNTNNYCDCFVNSQDFFSVGMGGDYCDDGIDQNCDGIDDVCGDDIIIIDNLDSSTSQSTGWVESTLYNGYYSSNYLYGGSNQWFEWNLGDHGIDSGEYEVYVSLIPLNGRPLSVTYEINHLLGSDEVDFDQEASNFEWNYLGTYFFNGYGNVILNSFTDSLEGTYVDALKIVKIGELAFECLIDEECSHLTTDFCDASSIMHNEGVCLNYECTYETTLLENCSLRTYNDIWNQCNLANGGIGTYGYEYNCNGASCVQTGELVNLAEAACTDSCFLWGSDVIDQDLCYDIIQTSCPSTAYPLESCNGDLFVTYQCFANDAVNDTLDCNSLDDWYDTTTTQWISNDQCTEKEQIQQEYRDYSCAIGGCQYSVTNTQYVDSGNIRNIEDGTSCDDGLFCTDNDQCSSGICGGIPINLEDGISCTIGSCDETNDIIIQTPNNLLCDDGLWCNGVETCDALLDCQQGTPVLCDDGYSCTDDLCDDEIDSCVYTQNDANCNDGEACNTNYFDPPSGCGVIVECTGQPDGSLCDDGFYCNGVDQCFGQTCVNVGPAINIDDGIDCTMDSCDEGNDRIVHSPNNSFCQNGLYCDGSEYCDSGLGCLSGEIIVCEDGNPNTIGECNEGTDLTDDLGECIYTEIPQETTQTINLNSGWNLVSIQIDSELTSSDLESMIIMKYEDNNWIMDFNNNNPFDLKILEGYYVYSSSEKEIIFEGLRLDEGYKYELTNETWNLFSVFEEGNSYNNLYFDMPAYSLFSASESVFEEITLDAVLSPGNFYWANLRGPEYSMPQSTTGFGGIFEGIIRLLFRDFI